MKKIIIGLSLLIGVASCDTISYKDVKDKYGCFEAIKPLEEASFLSWIEEYNNRINGYKFFIEKIEYSYK